MEQEIKCKEAHRVDGQIPQSKDVHLDKRICDCGKILFYSERGGCPGNPCYTLKSKPNE